MIAGAHDELNFEQESRPTENHCISDENIIAAEVQSARKYLLATELLSLIKR